MAASAQVPKNGRVKKPVTFWLCGCIVAVTLVNGRRFLQLTSDSNRRKTESIFVNMTIPTIFEIIFFFHCLSTFNDSLQMKTLRVPHDYRTGKFVVYCMQRLLKI